jgi:hypothetical protein
LKHVAKIVVFLSALAGLIWSSMQIHQHIMGKKSQAINSNNTHANIQDSNKTVRRRIELPNRRSARADNVAIPTNIASVPPQEVYNNLFGGICTYTIQNKTDYEMLVKILNDTNNIRLVYVPSGKEYSLKNLPEGKLKIRYGYGIGWDANRKTFKKTIGYAMGSSPIELKTQDIRVLRDGDIIRTKVCEGGVLFSAPGSKGKDATTQDTAIPASEF